MPTWDLLDESFANLTDWTDQDNINGESEIDPAGELRLDGNIAASNNYARQYRVIDSASFPDLFTVQVSLCHDLIGAHTDSDWFMLTCYQANERFIASFSTDGLQINDTGSGLTTVGSNLVKSGGSVEQQIWRFHITFGTLGAGVCDVYLYDSTHNWEKVGSAIPCSYEGSYTDGAVIINQYGFTTNDMLTHVDYVKALTGHHAVYPAELIFEKGSKPIPQHGIRIDRASNGDIRSQILHTADRQDFALLHRNADETNKALSDAFYAANKALEFTLPWIDDVGYNCMFAGAPQYTPLGAGRYDIQVNLAQKDE